MSLKKVIKQERKKIAKIEQEIKDLKLKRSRARKLENSFKISDEINAKYCAIENLELRLNIFIWMSKHPQNKKKELS